MKFPGQIMGVMFIVGMLIIIRAISMMVTERVKCEVSYQAGKGEPSCQDCYDDGKKLAEMFNRGECSVDVVAEAVKIAAGNAYEKGYDDGKADAVKEEPKTDEPTD